MENFSNAEVAKLLRAVAAALTLKKASSFQIRAYENAASSIEHSTAEIKGLWEEGKLDEVPGLGDSLQGHLDELFKTGQVKHFGELMREYPKVLFEMLDIPGVGPKTAYELTSLGIKDLGALEEGLKSGKLVEKGFSAKIAEKILAGMAEIAQQTDRMLLPYATAQANKILGYLKKSPEVIQADPLGSLRRKVATIGDLDFAAASRDSEKVVEYFTKMPGVKRIVDKGEYKGTLMLENGLHVDLLVGEPESYGALLQHFTGSKMHNIKLRTMAEEKGWSISENGIKKVKTGEVIPCKSEDELYQLMGMDTPAPEIREDNGEIEAALAHKLPDLIEFKDLKGDLHTHSSYPMVSPSHGPGAHSIEELVKEAERLGYKYIGISDHPPSQGLSQTELIEILEKRTKFIQELKKRTKSIRVLNSLEIDILGDGTLNVPDEILKTLDYCIAGIHSGHRGSKENITRRLLKALENPYVDIISHPTGRLLNERPSSDADWKEIFKFCGKNKKILEINSFYNRLDLRDDLVKQALEYGVKFSIDSDAHAVSQMDSLEYGVSVARRGWVTKKDVVNAWSFGEFADWFELE